MCSEQKNLNSPPLLSLFSSPFPRDSFFKHEAGNNGIHNQTRDTHIKYKPSAGSDRNSSFFGSSLFSPIISSLIQPLLSPVAKQSWLQESLKSVIVYVSRRVAAIFFIFKMKF